MVRLGLDRPGLAAGRDRASEDQGKESGPAHSRKVAAPRAGRSSTAASPVPARRARFAVAATLTLGAAAARRRTG